MLKYFNINKLFQFTNFKIIKINTPNLIYFNLKKNNYSVMERIENAENAEKKEEVKTGQEKGIDVDVKKDIQNKRKEKKDKKKAAADEIDDSKVKIVKGARDFMPYQMAIRNKAFKIITSVFKRHGAVEIDSPVFELKETLMGKYGEESKLIYDLQDQGGELLSLRYDLTVPFARYMAVHALPSIKRYHIGKVYRRDTPQMSKGRFREFYQCDFDIAGPNYGKMIPDSEVLKVVVEILSELKVGKFIIKLNHRKLLDATVALAGIGEDKFKLVCSSVDKLDKEPWADVKKELLGKGLDEVQTDKLWSFVQLRDSPFKLLEVLKVNEALNTNERAKEALVEMQTLFEYLDIMQVTDNFIFDLSLARGLDYYTGLIYEAVLTDSDKVGSIAGGGRYDDLLGMFGKESIPAVGVSIGIERIFNILEEHLQNDPSIRSTETEVLVAAVSKNVTKERLRICNELWSNGINAEILYNENPRSDKQNDFAINNRIPFVIFIGDDEIKENKVKVKCLANKTELFFSRDTYIQELQILRQDKSLYIIEHQDKKPKGNNKK